jgi:hypothetical protein
MKMVIGAELTGVGTLETFIVISSDEKLANALSGLFIGLRSTS